MKKSLLPLLMLVTMASAVFADTFRVTYTNRGLIKRITVQAESSAEARRTVMDMFAAAVVTGAHRVGK